MTVAYNLDVSSVKATTFFRLIFRWKGSIWKSVLSEVVAWTFVYYIVLVIYRFALSEDQQKTFAYFAQQCNRNLERMVPLTFMLAFFVSIIIDRWKFLFSNLGFVDSSALFLSAYLPGTDSNTRMVRRTIVRYMCLAQVLVLRDVSIRVKKRFPTLDSVIDAGFLTVDEKLLIEAVSNNYSKYWLPISWIYAIMFEQRAKNKISCDLYLNVILQERKLAKYFELRLVRNCSHLKEMTILRVPVPLAYPQVVCLSVWIYFLIATFARQHIVNPEHVVNGSFIDLVDIYFPFMTILQLIIYVGWLNVAMMLINPFGEDDADFELNFIIDRNLCIALSIVDLCHNKHPILRADTFATNNEAPFDTSSHVLPALAGSASQLLIENESDRKNSLATVGMKINEFRRRMSNAIAPEHSKYEDTWHQRPTLHISELINLLTAKTMPTIRSIDEVIDDSSSSDNETIKEKPSNESNH
ncbi:Bestrophin/UPF0187 family-containing protein [Aphelenchoides besseyi]|nr:Bestrophin/UPF0187 family-containing protein [Aphelenchoides besseyi]